MQGNTANAQNGLRSRLAPDTNSIRQNGSGVNKQFSISGETLGGRTGSVEKNADSVKERAAQLGISVSEYEEKRRITASRMGVSLSRYEQAVLNEAKRKMEFPKFGIHR